ncbi:MAG: hypothetical protein JWQ19_3897 [Subtercola sp.]|nr:hypothetical protein [Subtercola sp.]
MAGMIRVGISGWQYPRWRGVFYPPDLPQKRELAYAATQFQTIEINGTFYSQQKSARFLRWSAETPSDFVFTLKGPRYISHMLRLKNCRAALANFFATGPLALDAKLGPILWQLPPTFAFDPKVLTEFFNILPRTSHEARTLARCHDEKLRSTPWLKVGAERPIRYAIEVRHDSFITPAFVQLLRQQKIGLVVADTVEWPLLMDVTSDFVYVRLHGSTQLYSSGYGAKALQNWATRIAAWSEGAEVPGQHAGTSAKRRTKRDVYVLFDNDAKVRAPFDAKSLRRRLERTRAGQV